MVSNLKGQEDLSSPSILLFLGPTSSFTHQKATRLIEIKHTQAALESVDHDAYDFLPAESIEDVFEAVQFEESTLGIVPLENSTNGSVVLTFEQLADRQNRYPDVKICRETYLNINHYLLGRHVSPHPNDSPIASGACTPTLSTPSPLIPRTAPLSSLKHIKRLYSHPQAWGQCDVFLATYLKNIDRIDVSSTSKAAELVVEDKTETSAAIASRLVSEVIGLDILAERIEDIEDNRTRFVFLHKGKDLNAGLTKKTKSMISFRINHEIPGALALILRCFVTFSLNLLNINSRPTKVKPFQYVFFLEFEGSLNNDPEDKVKNAICALQEYVTNWRYLGSWDDEAKE
ncbi:P-protein [Golovinomyces cichoracearum]|uniref:prephenate dehydratase n=1 Tax=Golovinomyces cichoracearum TaxID=62708 RepID=A0A420ISM4_9PEZI|nr:P-protein [Golovinomyces cichoracearum]